MNVTDDGIRERHGMKCTQLTGGSGNIQAWEDEQSVRVEHSSSGGAALTIWQARYLARKLYRLARRIEKRQDDGQA
jgi:hypothetical protein